MTEDRISRLQSTVEPDPALWDKLLGKPGELFQACSEAVRSGDASSIEDNAADWTEAIRATDDTRGRTMAERAGALLAFSMALARDEAESHVDLAGLGATSHPIGDLVELAPSEVPDDFMRTLSRSAQQLIRDSGDDRRPEKPFLALLAAALEEALPSPRARVDVPVLFERRGHGQAAWLRLVEVANGPCGMYPHPARTFCFTSDSDFSTALQIAWRQSRQAEDEACVLWSLELVDGTPVHEADGPSLGAAVALGLDELRRNQAVLGTLRLLRIDRRKAVSAELSPDGDLVAVRGIVPKLKAAKDARLEVVLPEANRADVLDSSGVELPLDRIHFAGSLADAFRLVRTEINNSIIRLAALTTAVTLVVAVATVQYFSLRQDTSDAERREAAARLLNEAALVEQDDPVLAELLALQSYEIVPSDRATDYLFAALGRDAALVTALFGHSSAVTEISMMAGGTRAVSADQSGEIRVWDLERRKPLGDPFEEHESPVRALTASHLVPQFASGDDNGRLLVWDMPVDGLVTHRVLREGGEAEVLDVSYSSDDTRIAAALSDGNVEIYHSDSGVLLARVDVVETANGLLGLQGSSERLQGDIAPAVAFTPAGNLLVGVRNNLLVLPVTDGSVVRKILPDSSEITSIGVEPSNSPEDSGVFVGTDIGLTRWTSSDDTLTQAPQVATRVTDIEFYAPNPGDSGIGLGQVVVSTEDESLVLNTQTVRVVQPLGPASSAVAAIPNDPLPYEVSLVATAHGREIRLWDLAQRGLRGLPVGIQATEIEFLPDGRMITGSPQGEVRVVEEDAPPDVVQGDVWLSSVTDPTNASQATVFDIDTNSEHVVISTASPFRPVEVLAIETGDPVDTPALDEYYRRANGGVRSAAFTQDGDVLVTAAFDGRVAAWSTDDWHLLADYEGTWGVQAVSVGPGDRRVAVANVGRGNLDDSEGGLFTVLDLESLTPVGEPVPVDNEGLTDIEFIDQDTVATGTTSGRLLTFDVGSRRPEQWADFGSSDNWVIDLAISVDGEVLAAVAPDTVFVMDALTGLRRGLPLTAPGMDAFDAAFSPNVNVLSVSNFSRGREGPYEDGTPDSIDQWDLDRTSWRAAVCRHAGRDLTEDEWDTYGGGAAARQPVCGEFLHDEAERLEAEIEARREAAEDGSELEEAAGDAWSIEDVGDEPLVPLVTGGCGDLAVAVPAGQRYDCGILPGGQTAWLAMPGDDATERRPTVRFYSSLSSGWRPTGAITPKEFIPYSTEVYVREFGRWRRGDMLVTFVYERFEDHLVTDGNSILHEVASPHGALAPEGSGLRLVDRAAVGYESTCCYRGSVTSLIDEVDGEWTAGPTHIMANTPPAYANLDTGSLQLEGTGIGGIEFGAPFDTVLARVGSSYRTSASSSTQGPDAAQSTSDVVWTDGIAAEAGSPWPMSEPLELREVCWWERALCLYGTPPTPTDAGAFVGWAYGVPAIASEAPGAYDSLRLETDTGGYLGDRRRLLNDEDEQETSDGERRYDSLREIPVEGQAAIAVVQAGEEPSIRAIVAGWHRPVGAVPAPTAVTGASPWQLDLMDYWSLVERDVTDASGSAQRWQGSAFGEGGFGYVVEQFTVTEDRAAGIADDISLASTAMFPPAPPEFSYRSLECNSGSLAGEVIVQLGRTTGRPDRQWSVDPAGFVHPLETNIRAC